MTLTPEVGRMRVEIKRTFGIAAIAIAAVLVLARCADKQSFYANTQASDTFVQLYNVDSYDFLWVLDNSPSMDPKRQYVADNIQSFLTVLNSRKAVDYQMAVTNVDWFTTAGALITATGGLNVVKSTSASPSADFAAIVNTITDTNTSFWEQGLISAYAAINNSGSTFIRNGVPLVVILMSDDDDWSCKQMSSGITSCSGIQPENNPDAILYDTGYFLSFFENYKKPQNTDVTVFPVVGMANSDCVVERVGTRYQEIAQKMGGFSKSGSICLSDIGTSMNNIAQTLADRGTTFPLSQQSNGEGIQVYVNSVLIPYSQDNGWTYDSTTNSVIFNGSSVPANGAVISVNYSEQTNSN